MIDGITGPSIGALLEDMRALASDFARLFGTECECLLRTDRTYYPSRFTEPYIYSTTRRADGGWEEIRASIGLVVSPAYPGWAENAQAVKFYDRGGWAYVNALGHPALVRQGFADVHTIKMRGPGKIRARETLTRADAVACAAESFWRSILWPGQEVGVSCLTCLTWPDLVARVAELAGRSTLNVNAWHVSVEQQDFSLVVWQRRENYFGPLNVSEAIAGRIGYYPECIWAERRAFLSDSEFAANWLIERLAERLAELVRDEIASPETAPECSLNTDGRVLVWAGKSYDPLTKTGFAVVKVFYEAWKKGRPEVSLQTIKQIVDSSALDEALAKVFQRTSGGKKVTDPVWYLIEAVSQGVYRLVDPKKL